LADPSGPIGKRALADHLDTDHRDRVTW
jgi:hypothetical protein